MKDCYVCIEEDNATHYMMLQHSRYNLPIPKYLPKNGKGKEKRGAFLYDARCTCTILCIHLYCKSTMVLHI